MGLRPMLRAAPFSSFFSSFLFPFSFSSLPSSLLFSLLPFIPYFSLLMAQNAKCYSGPLSPVKHVHTRRAFFHDYRKPCIYMFTITKHQMAPIFSKLEGNPYIMSGADAPHTVLNRAGVIVKEELDKLESFRRDKIRIIKSVIMPDHLHFVVRVLNELPKPVTVYVGLTMSACTRRLRDEGILSEDSSCFNPGISDSIVYKSGQLDVLYKYVTDNPRRLMIKRMLPQLGFKF